MGVMVIRNNGQKSDERYNRDVVMVKSNHSYRVGQKITEKFNLHSWSNQRCFILAGGPSLSGFDYTRLNNELTIGINKSFKYYPNATINYSMDPAFYDDMRNNKLDSTDPSSNLWMKWLEFRGTRIFLSPMERKEDFGKEVYLIRRQWKPSINRNDLDEGIYGGKNSGLGAIMLAAALGSKQIFLLGYDMKVQGQKTHNHDGYPNRNVQSFSQHLTEYCQEIWNMSDLLMMAGIEVINLTPDSALRCFRFSTLDEVLKC